MLVLTGDDVSGLLPPAHIIAAVEVALRAMEAGRCVVPQRMHVARGDTTLLCMPAIGEDYLGTKLVAIVPDNAARGLPVTNGIMVLNDGPTGLPLAILYAGALTALRTGAVGAVGLKHITPPDADSVGIVGCGVQGAWQAIFACAVRPIQEILCTSRRPARVEQFAATVRCHVPHVRITPCSDARELLARTTVVIAATTSAEPVLPDEPALLAGKHFVSIGSYTPAMQELPDAVYRLAGHLVLDSELARHEVGDAIRPVEKGILKDCDLFSISQLVTGLRAVDVNRTTAYKSAGMALFDLFVATTLYETAKERHVGCDITF